MKWVNWGAPKTTNQNKHRFACGECSADDDDNEDGGVIVVGNDVSSVTETQCVWLDWGRLVLLMVFLLFITVSSSLPSPSPASLLTSTASVYGLILRFLFLSLQFDFSHTEAIRPTGKLLSSQQGILGVLVDFSIKTRLFYLLLFLFRSLFVCYDYSFVLFYF